MLIAQRPTLTEEVVDEYRSRFVIEPLEPGFGYTLGNSLRRTLLSSIPGAAVTSIRIDGVLHEFTTVPGVKEDVTDLILNIKQLVVSSRARRAGRDVPAQAGARRGHRRRHRAAGRCRGAQPRPAHRHAQRQGQAGDGADRRARPRLRLRRPEQAGRPGDRPHPGRLDLLAGAQGHLQGRGDPCRAAHRLRQADRRRRDQAVDAAARRHGVAPARPWSSCSAWPASSTSRPRASTWARRRRTPRWPPTWRCRSRSWTSPSARTTASSARASTPWASSWPAARPTCSTSATSVRSRSTRSRRSSPAWAWRSRTARPGSTRAAVVDSFGADDDTSFAEAEQF